VFGVYTLSLHDALPIYLLEILCVRFLEKLILSSFSSAVFIIALPLIMRIAKTATAPIFNILIVCNLNLSSCNKTNKNKNNCIEMTIKAALASEKKVSIKMIVIGANLITFVSVKM